MRATQFLSFINSKRIPEKRERLVFYSHIELELEHKSTLKGIRKNYRLRKKHNEVSPQK